MIKISEDNKDKDKSRTLEGILALTSSLGVLFLNSMTLYSLMDKAGVYTAKTVEYSQGIPVTMDTYVILNLPVAFCAATGGLVIGKYVGRWMDNLRNKKRPVQLEFDFKERK